jgi:hypothetical protein
MKLKDLLTPTAKEVPMADSTYGVEVFNGATAEWYLGNDEKLWDWANAPVNETFRDGLAEMNLPEGYVLQEDEAGDVALIVGDTALGDTTALISEQSTRDDMSYILIHSMRQVSYKEFKDAKLPNERVMRSTSF